MAKNESKFWQQIKKITPEISWTRIENTSSLGTQDALCYNANQFYFTIEFKVSKRNKVSLSPHQIAYHVKHPKNSFILVKTPEACGLKLYEGSSVLELAACGLKLEACSLGLEACRQKLYSLGA